MTKQYYHRAGMNLKLLVCYTELMEVILYHILTDAVCKNLK